MTYPEPQPSIWRAVFWLIFASVMIYLAGLAGSARGAEPPPWCVQIDVKDDYGSLHGH